MYYGIPLTSMIMENSDKDRFDAELVLLADDDIEKSDLRLYEGKVNIVRPFKVFNTILLERKLREKMGESEEIVNMILGDRVEEMNKAFDKSVIEIIREGRMRISLLLDSLGGIVASALKRKEYMDYIKSHNGRIEAYLKHGEGPATDMFLNSDERIIAPFSTLVYSQLNGGTPDFREETNMRLRGSLFGSVSQDKKEELEDILEEAEEQDPENPQPFFNAEAMMNLGMATKQVQSLEEMRQVFLERTGIAMLPKHLSDEFELGVQRFFKDE